MSTVMPTATDLRHFVSPLEQERERSARLQARNDELTLMLRLASQFLGDFHTGWVESPGQRAMELEQRIDKVLEGGAK